MPQAATATSTHRANPQTSRHLHTEAPIHLAEVEVHATYTHNHEPANSSGRLTGHSTPTPGRPNNGVPNDRNPLITNPQASTPTRHRPASPPSRHRDARTPARCRHTAPTRTHRALSRLWPFGRLDARGLSHLRTRTERGAATAEYAITIVGACAIGGVLVSLLKSPGMLNALKSIINYGLKMAGVEGVHL